MWYNRWKRGIGDRLNGIKPHTKRKKRAKRKKREKTKRESKNRSLGRHQ